MWKVLLSLISQRLILLAVAFIAINQTIPSMRQPSSPSITIVPQVHPTPVLWQRLLSRVAETLEGVRLTELMRAPATQVFWATPNPFLWICRWVAGTTRLSPVQALLLMSNVFLLLFLWEMNSLFNRMTTPDTASAATILIVLWPTTYELSLGSTFAMTCFLLALCMRHALDNRWLVVGFAVGALALLEPLAIGVLPILLYMFWYYQRHYPLGQLGRNTLYFLVPVGIAMGWRLNTYSHLWPVFSSSALFNVISATKSVGPSWTFSQSYVGQTIALVFFGLGAVAAFMSNTNLIHRIIPLNMLLLLLLFSPYSALASRAPLAAACLEGIASASSRTATRIVATLMLVLSAYEVYSVFH